MVAKSKGKAKAKGKSKPKLSPEEAETRNKILENFRSFDLNGDGQLQRGELKALLKVLDPDNWTDDAIERLVQAFDKDGDGDISLEEFVDWVTGATDADHDAFVETLHKTEVDVDMINHKHAKELLALLQGFDVAAETQKLKIEALLKVTEVADPSAVFLQGLGLVYLLLQPSTAKATGKPVNFNQPSWTVIQKLLQDSSFLQRVGAVDKRRAEMKSTHSAVAEFAVDHFLCVPAPGGEERPSPLTYEGLEKACQAHKLGKTGPVMVLFKWCLTLLDANLRELAKDRLRAQATHDFKEEEMRKKDTDAQEAISKVKSDAADLLHGLDDFLAEVEGPPS